MKPVKVVIAYLSAMVLAAGCASTKVVDRQEYKGETSVSRPHLGVRLCRHSY